MCVSNSMAISMLGQAAIIQRLEWESELVEMEMDRLIKREKKIVHMLHRMQRVLNSNALPEVKVAVIKSMCERGPIFPDYNEISNT